MRYAVDKDKNKILATSKQKAFCPNCHSIVISKCGMLKVWHWAHKKDSECDLWKYEPITEWHIEWQK
jgi:competence CoiA-like predicted nuclease